jgi:hypothetical protein
MSQDGWIIKKGVKHLHGYSVVDEKIVRPKWLNKRTGALVFSREHGGPIARALGAVLVRV